METSFRSYGRRTTDRPGPAVGGPLSRSSDAEITSPFSRRSPSVCELEVQLRKVALGKAYGMDALPSELLHSSSAYLSHRLWPLLMKMTARAQGPLQYKGGKLIALFKQKGSAMECSSYRAILVSSALGKALHNVYRARAAPYLQSSAQRGAMVAMAAHTVRLAQGAAKHHGLSDYILFLDIASAYYTLLRKHAVDKSFGDEDVICFLRRMQIPETNIGVPPHLRGTPSFEGRGR